MVIASILSEDISPAAFMEAVVQKLMCSSQIHLESKIMWRCFWHWCDSSWTSWKTATKNVSNECAARVLIHKKQLKTVWSVKLWWLGVAVGVSMQVVCNWLVWQFSRWKLCSDVSFNICFWCKWMSQTKWTLANSHCVGMILLVALEKLNQSSDSQEKSALNIWKWQGDAMKHCHIWINVVEFWSCTKWDCEHLNVHITQTCDTWTMMMQLVHHNVSLWLIAMKKFKKWSMKDQTQILKNSN